MKGRLLKGAVGEFVFQVLEIAEVGVDNIVVIRDNGCGAEVHIEGECLAVVSRQTLGEAVEARDGFGKGIEFSV